MQYTKLSIDINDQQKGIGMSFFLIISGLGHQSICQAIGPVKNFACCTIR